MTARLLIELDGAQHNSKTRKAKDDQRTQWLESEGYRVIRFWNNDTSDNVTPPRCAPRTDPPPPGEGEE